MGVLKYYPPGRTVRSLSDRVPFDSLIFYLDLTSQPEDLWFYLDCGWWLVGGGCWMGYHFYCFFQISSYYTYRAVFFSRVWTLFFWVAYNTKMANMSYIVTLKLPYNISTFFVCFFFSRIEHFFIRSITLY